MPQLLNLLSMFLEGQWGQNWMSSLHLRTMDSMTMLEKMWHYEKPKCTIDRQKEWMKPNKVTVRATVSVEVISCGKRRDSPWSVQQQSRRSFILNINKKWNAARLSLCSNGKQKTDTAEEPLCLKLTPKLIVLQRKRCAPTWTKMFGMESSDLDTRLWKKKCQIKIT